MNKAKTERNERINMLREAGATYDAIAREFGLTRQRVEQIVHRKKRAKVSANGDLLVSMINRRGETVSDVAQKLGMSAPSLSSRIHGRIEFKLSEMVAIKEALDLSDFEFNLIFLTDSRV